MRIYRIEKDGQGPFRRNDGGSLVYEAIAMLVATSEGDLIGLLDFWDPRSPYRHPGPESDVPGWRALSDACQSDPYVCGFASMDQLLAWFDSEAVRGAMHELGAEVLEYEIDESHVLKGGCQVVFLKTEASLVSTMAMPVSVH